MSESPCSSYSSSRSASLAQESESHLLVVPELDGRRLIMMMHSVASISCVRISTSLPFMLKLPPILARNFRSFYLGPVYRLVPIFSPFLMAALLVSISRVLPPCRLNAVTPDFQDHRTLRVSLSRLCNAERALGHAALCALPGSALPHRWCARVSRKESN